MDNVVNDNFSSLLHNRDTSGIVYIRWTEKNVKKYLDDSGYEVNKVRGNGFCILAAVARGLLFDHSYLASIGQIQERIIQHLIRRPDLYEGFPGGTPEALATEAANFFENKNFNRDLVDMLLLAVADALNLRIKIIRESPCGYIQVLIVEGQNPQFLIHLRFGSHVP